MCTILGEKEQLQESAYQTLRILFQVQGAAFADGGNIHHLSGIVVLLIDGIHGKNPQSRATALNALKACLESLPRGDLWIQFLPGVVSALFKVLIPNTGNRYGSKMLVGALEVLKEVLTLSVPKIESNEASGQIYNGFRGVVRLKIHERGNVRGALAELCSVVLGLENLKACTPLAVETLLELAVNTDDVEQKLNPFSNILQSILYEKVEKLPAIIAGADDQKKIITLQQIAVGYGLIYDDKSTLDVALANALQDSVNTTLSAAPSLLIQDETSLVHTKGQKDVLSAIESLLQKIHSPTLTIQLSERLEPSNPELAPFWLLLTANELTPTTPMDEIYSLSLSLLTSPTPPTERLQSLALRALSHQATLTGRPFRLTLIDTLYPVLHTLATPSATLQTASLQTLDTFTSACEYPNPAALILDNVDYLTNAIALKLGSFDLRPQTPQVLIWMLRLTGAALVPYLGDVVESISVALEMFHGYPALVEVLFAVLRGVVEAGSTFDEAGRGDRLLPYSSERMGISAVAAFLVERRAEFNSEQGGRERAPQRPWKDLAEDGGEGKYLAEDRSDVEDEDQDEESSPPEEAPPEKSQTFKTLLKISSLTKYFLPSHSPSLRGEILSLLLSSIPALARDEDSFLPLVNDLWPGVVHRLRDPEVNVRILAWGVVGAFAREAGSFLRERVQGIWGDVRAVWGEVGMRGDVPPRGLEGGGGKGVLIPVTDQGDSEVASRTETNERKITLHPNDGIASQGTDVSYQSRPLGLLREAVKDAVLSIVEYATVPPEAFDDVLFWLRAEIGMGEERTMKILERENDDAVWLTRYKMGLEGEIDNRGDGVVVV
ncbi:hypothetical protein K470DRAFT_256017 [Piedraia hortae CBS 480.64]|uniref:ARM repeat-containing protein n=1 Tax=Piedraia hortae CBS 480.64 TaxID=1314780 RepID=A0A6A7C4J7_9PEZI|nr:hypothetical protein K470DRAFT_256017 [Piedraia hortae CBS 480.64]